MATDFLNTEEPKAYTDDVMQPQLEAVQKDTMPQAEADEAVATTLIASGQDLENAERYSSQLQEYGRSTELEGLQHMLHMQRNQAYYEGAALNVEEFGAEAALAMAEEDMAQPFSPEVEYLKNLAMRYSSEEEWLQYTVDAEIAEQEYEAEIYDLFAEYSDNMTMGSTAWDMLGMMAPMMDAAYLIQSNAALSEHFGVDIPEGGDGLKAVLDVGGAYNQQREIFAAIPKDQRVEAVRFMLDWGKEHAGLLSGNELQALTAAQHMVAGDLSQIDFEGPDWERALMTGIGILDFTGVIGGAARIARGTRAAKRATLLDRTKRANPEFGRELEIAAMSEESGRLAAGMGVSREELFRRTLLPETDEAYIDITSPQYKMLMKKRDDMLLMMTGNGKDITAAEKLAEYKAIEKSLQSTAELRGSYQNSKLDVDLNGVNVKGHYIFDSAGDVQKIVADMQARFGGNAKVVAETTDYVGKIVERTEKRAVRTEKEALGILKAELTEAAGGKLARGQTTAGKAAGKEQGAARVELKYNKDLARAIKNPKSNVKKDLKAKAEKLVQAKLEQGGFKMLRKTAEKAVLKDLDEQIVAQENALNRLAATDRANSAATKAEADLSRLEQGAIDSLSAGSKARLRALTRPEKVKVQQPILKQRATVSVEFRKDFKGAKGGLDPERIADFGGFARYFSDVTVGMAKDGAKALLAATDRVTGYRGKLNTFLEPVLKSSDKQIQATISILQRGNKNEEVYTSRQIMDMMGEMTGYTEKDALKVAENYWSVRQLSDIMYNVRNQKVRNEWMEEGFRHIEEGSFAGPAKMFTKENAASNVGSYFDPVRGVLVDTTRDPDMVKRLYDEGFVIVQAKEQQKLGNTATNFVMISREAKNTELPEQVLSYIKGYVPRMYESQYFIKRKAKGKVVYNGVKEEARWETVATVRSAKDWDAMKAKLEAEMGDGFEFDIKYDRNLSQKETDMAMREYESFSGRLYYGKRGMQLKDFADHAEDITDPIEAMSRSINSLANEQMLRPVLDLEKSRWQAQFGDVLGMQGKWPSRVEEIASDSANPAVQRQVRQARTHWEYINRVEGMSMVDGKFSDMMVGFGEYLEGKGMDKLGEWVRTKGGAYLNPLKLSKKLMFMASIVLNPVRQLFIQSQQQLFLAGIEPKYVMSGGALRQGFVLTGGTLAEMDVKSMAKAAGMSVQEMKDVKRAFESTGLLESVDINQLGRAALMDVHARGVKRGIFDSARDLGSKALDAAQSIGFDMGERLNLGSTYMIAYRRWKRDNPGKRLTSVEDMTAVAEDARILSMSMTQGAKFGYQDGLFSAATQFLSVQHKAFTMMAPAVPGLRKYGNKAITPAEARRIAVGQLFLYGAGGLGIYEIIDGVLEEAGVTLDPTARQIIAGGAYDRIFNMVATAIGGETTDLAPSKSIAAGGGFYGAVPDMVDRLLNDGVPSFMFGASATAWSKVGGIVKTLGKFSQSGWAMDGEDWQILLNDGLRIASMYNNGYLAHHMIKNQSEMTSQMQALGIPANTTEAWMKGLFGIDTYKKSAYYDFVMEQSDIKKALEEDAKIGARYINTKLSGMSGMDGEQAMKQLDLIAREATALHRAGLGDGDLEYFMNKLRMNLRESNFTDRIYEMVMKGRFVGDTASQLRQLAQAGLINDEDLSKLTGLIEAFEGKGE